MSTLLVQKLVSELSQEMRYNNSGRCSIACLAPYLFVYNSPSGTFTFEILNSDDESIFTQDFTVADIKTSLDTADGYAHVFYPIVPVNPIQLEAGLYTVKITSFGYTPTDLSYLGWIQQFENIQNEMDYVASTDSANPLAIRIKKYA